MHEKYPTALTGATIIPNMKYICGKVLDKYYNNLSSYSVLRNVLKKL